MAATEQDHASPSVELTGSDSPSSRGVFTPTSSVDAAFDPDVDRRSPAPTTQAIFENLRLRELTRGAADASGDSHSSGQATPQLTPSSYHTTYRDLCNATPSPAGAPSAEPREPRPQTPTSSLAAVSSHLGNLNLADSQNAAFERPDRSDYLYNIRGEELPEAAVYDIRLRDALRDVRGRLTDLAQGMGRQEQAQDITTPFHNLYKQVYEASRFTHPATRTVGFIGDSGMGKSSTINSILDQGGLARSSGNGAACTTVVTEFRSVDDEHRNNYTVEADFMDNTEIRELLEELLSAVRKYYTGAYQEVSQPQEQENIRSTATRAWETLVSLFPNQPELNLDFVSQDGEDAVEPIITRLEEWAMAGQESRPGGRDNLRYSVEANHADECKEQLDRLMANSREGHRPALWPFIKLIRVYLESPILRTGLVLADLPGFRDLNYARVRATEKYLRHHCDEVFVVSTIVRCTTDRSIDEIIHRCVKGPPIRIVCTCSENVHAIETAREYPGDEAMHIYDLDGRIKALGERINNVKTQRLQATGSRRQTLSVEQADLGDEKDALELERTQFLITRRNQRVTESLLRTWGRQTRVFCVSNSLYSEYRPMQPGQTNAYLELSGIRELRRYCQSVPADAQLRATESFLENRLPATLGSLSLWASAGADSVTIRRSDVLRGVLDEAVQTLQRTITSHRSVVRLVQSDLEEQFEILIKQKIRAQTAPQLWKYHLNVSVGDSRDDWKNSAIDASREWARWNHGTYAAWCRHYGTHRTGGQSYRCWNEEILGQGITQLSNSWDSMLDFLEDKEDGLDEAISELFQGLCDSIEGHNDIAADTLQTLTLNLTARQRCINRAIHDSFDGLICATLKVKLDTIGGHDSSYIGGIMRPVYNSCMEQYGTGSDSRRKQAMNRHLTSSPLFRDFATKIAADYRNLTERTLNGLDLNLRNEIANVIQDLRASVTVERNESEAGGNPRYAEELKQKIESIQGALAHARRIVMEVGQRVPDSR